ncbi:MAG: hypothetical protein R3C28_21080 [Pirellulaceae bacterium]
MRSTGESSELTHGMAGQKCGVFDIHFLSIRRVDDMTLYLRENPFQSPNGKNFRRQSKRWRIGMGAMGCAIGLSVGVIVVAMSPDDLFFRSYDISIVNTISVIGFGCVGLAAGITTKHHSVATLCGTVFLALLYAKHIPPNVRWVFLYLIVGSLYGCAGGVAIDVGLFLFEVVARRYFKKRRAKDNSFP